MTDKSNDETSRDTSEELSPLQESVQRLVSTVTDKAVSSLSNKVLDATGRLNEYAAQQGGPGLLAAVTGAEKLGEGKSPVKAAMGAGMAAVKQGVKDKLSAIKNAFTGGKGKGKGKKIINIVESIDVGVPVQVAYDQWTLFGEFPQFMKKLEKVEQVSDEKLSWKAQVFWSHRTWESTIIEQVPGERIVWRSKGAKGFVDGAVTFHELTPDLTRILVVLEYHPQGFFEKTGNIWRAQGRRMRLELKHFQRHVMTQTILHQEEVEGWPGEIRDGKVVEPEEEPEEGEEPGEPEAEEGEETGERGSGEREEDEGEEDEYEEEDEESKPPQKAPRRRPAGRTRKEAAASGPRRKQGART